MARHARAPWVMESDGTPVTASERADEVNGIESALVELKPWHSSADGIPPCPRLVVNA